MPIGANGGGNLNILMFEVVMVRQVSEFAPPIIRTVGLHPMVVAPTSIRYSDASRGSVEETALAATDEIAGRALRTIDLDGTFGAEARGFGIYIGTGELRFKRFYHEVVRLPDAVNQAQVDAEKDLFRSPLLNVLLAAYDEDTCYFGINFYDFWNDRAFSVRIPSWQDSRGNFGNAQGVVSYRMSLHEAGGLITGGLGTTLIKGLMDILTAWDSVNELLKSYRLDVILESLGALNQVVLTQMFETYDALGAQLDAVKNVLTGASRSSLAPVPEEPDDATPQGTAPSGATRPAGVAAFLSLAKDLSAQATAAAFVALAQRSDEDDTAQGEVSWGTQSGEGAVVSLGVAEGIDALASIAYAAEYQRVAGVFAGMSRQEYQTLIESTSEANRDAGLGARSLHVVTQTDTARSISEQYSIPWRKILDLNRLLPDEALLPGRKLNIPSIRPLGMATRIVDLPVFGSHAGQAAFGRDLDVDLSVDDVGQLLTLEGEDVLQQGSQWLLRMMAPELLDRLKHADGMGEAVRTGLLRKQLTRMYLTDRRIANVVEIRTTPDGDSSLAIDVVCQAINGSTVTLGA